ncbi:hypothetical protein AS9A_2327 [Hoyosella subflava DQS3-9A1]|uniref:Uncharacterized protein n=1 Tax=Hoyosella subflava (strain DSM 45089 / JCM 17490 / NBRC 109087 / DQS3-9A1) TaxID=443218 RepID=F6ERV9_HOYSD|nr:hypothetical protein AS9A_2327 [Hoyosella subflava DQS3-9A1]
MHHRFARRRECVSEPARHQNPAAEVIKIAQFWQIYATPTDGLGDGALITAMLSVF